MKIIFKYLFLFLFTGSAQAAIDSFYNDEAYLVLPGSELQKSIDQAIGEIFKSNIGIGLCTAFQNEKMLFYGLGVSLEKASEIIKNCKFSYRATVVPKLFKKRYYVIPNFDMKIDVQSWTTLDNKTYLWLDPTMSTKTLKDILSHEIAIALDGKMNMFWTTYLKYEAMQKASARGKSVDVYIYFNKDSMTTQEKSLMTAFNISGGNSLKLAFATLRAFSFEEMIENQAPRQITDHKSCAERLTSLYDYFSKNIKFFQETKMSLVDYIVTGSLSDQISNNFNQDRNQEEDFKFISSSGLKMPNSRQTFCQYMATPILSARTVDTLFAKGPRPRTLFAKGPRPRVVGGWDKTTRTEDSLKSAGSQGWKAEKKAAPELMIEKFKGDLEKNKIIKIKN